MIKLKPIKIKLYPPPKLAKSLLQLYIYIISINFSLIIEPSSTAPTCRPPNTATHLSPAESYRSWRPNSSDKGYQRRKYHLN